MGGKATCTPRNGVKNGGQAFEIKINWNFGILVSPSFLYSEPYLLNFSHSDLNVLASHTAIINDGRITGEKYASRKTFYLFRNMVKNKKW